MAQKQRICECIRSVMEDELNRVVAVDCVGFTVKRADLTNLKAVASMRMRVLPLAQRTLESAEDVKRRAEAAAARIHELAEDAEEAATRSKYILETAELTTMEAELFHDMDVLRALSTDMQDVRRRMDGLMCDARRMVLEIGEAVAEAHAHAKEVRAMRDAAASLLRTATDVDAHHDAEQVGTISAPPGAQ